MHDFGVGGCLNPYGNQICKCGSSQCEVDTAYPFSWVDISATGTLITDWSINADDGYFRVELPFDFTWFGSSTRTVMIGTNGFLTLGDDAAPSHQSTLPIPCAETGCGEGDRSLAVGLLAVFWCVRRIKMVCRCFVLAALTRVGCGPGLILMRAQTQTECSTRCLRPRIQQFQLGTS